MSMVVPSLVPPKSVQIADDGADAIALEAGSVAPNAP